MTDIHFYSNPQSRGQIVHWMLEELGEPYETHWIEYGEQMKSAAYLAINPMGKVPAIQHRGATVTEVSAICTYLAASFPEKGLIPAVGTSQLADFYRWMFFAAGPIELAVTVKAMGWTSNEDQSRTLGYGSEEDVCRAIELALANGPFVCGDKFTAVDVYLGSHLRWGMQFGTIEKRPTFAEYVARLSERPALQRSIELTEQQVKQ